MTFPNGARKPLGFWYDLQVAVVAWLAETGRLTEDMCPLTTYRAAHTSSTPFRSNKTAGHSTRPKQIGNYWIDSFPNAYDHARLHQDHPAALRRRPHHRLRILINEEGVFGVSAPGLTPSLRAGTGGGGAPAEALVLAAANGKQRGADQEYDRHGVCHGDEIYAPAAAVKINTAAEAFGRFSAMNAPPAATIDAKTASIPRQTATLDSSEPNVIPNSPKFRTAAPPTTATAPHRPRSRIRPLSGLRQALLFASHALSQVLSLLRPPTQVGPASRGGLVQPSYSAGRAERRVTTTGRSSISSSIRRITSTRAVERLLRLRLGRLDH